MELKNLNILFFILLFTSCTSFENLTDDRHRPEDDEMYWNRTEEFWVTNHEPTNKIYIIDFKTSTWGWGDKEKKNEIKQFQLLLYKKYFSDHFKFPIDNIEIEFFIYAHDKSIM